MLEQLKESLGLTYDNLNRIEVNAANLISNYRYVSSISPDIAVAPVIKSNAYGHDIVTAAAILDRLNPPMFCVDSLFEAYQLYKAKIKTPILIIGYTNPANLSVKTIPFAFTVFSDEMLEGIKKYQPKTPIHIFVDTGMHREGVPLDKLEAFITKAQGLNLRVGGLMSHLAMPDNPNNSDTKNQIDNFQKAIGIAKRLGVNPKYQHLAASIGILREKTYRGKLGDLSRSGIALFGIDPEDKNHNLKPALDFKSTIIQIKTLKHGESVGYDFTFTAKKNMRVAVIPAGYNDGVDRRLSNKGVFTIDGIECPILGRVSMNITVIDVSKVPNVSVGQPAIIYSADPTAPNCIVETAKLCNTIPYEILIHLNPSTKRIVV